MKWGVQVVKPSTHNSESTSLLVNFAGGRYLFNCGEGTQRLCFENTMRISRLTAVFLTRVDWENMGGLPGMLLTLADSGTRNLTICGGHNLTHALAATRHFVLRNNMGIGVKELRDGDAAAAFADDNVSVAPVHLYPEGYTPSADERGPDQSEEAKQRRAMLARALGVCEKPEAQGKKGRRSSGQPQPQPPQQRKKGHYGGQCQEAAVEEHLQRIEKQQGDAVAAHMPAAYSGHDAMQGGNSSQHLPPTRPTPATLCYIVEGPEVPGKFDPQAARALGLKPGPNFSRLVNGESITAPDGTVIRPEQCVGPARASGIFIVVDCPSASYIASLIASTRFAPFFGESQPGDASSRLLLVVHSLGAGVAQDPRYRAWASQFPAHVRHMVSAPEYVADNNPFQRHLRIQTSMAAVNPRVFVLPQATGTSELPLDTFLPGRDVIAPHSMAAFDIEPKPRLDVSLVRQLLTPEEMLAKEAPEAAHMVSTCAAGPAAAEDDVELAVCPIGTGSSVPSIYRNVSANIVSVGGYGGVVLDCGESTVSLLKRFLGYPQRNAHNTRIRQSYVEFVASLKLLYISHMHADHHLGAVLLLHEWARLTRALAPQPRLTIVGPSRFWVWLEDYTGVQDLELDRVDFVSCRDIQLADPAAAGKTRPKSRYDTLDRAKVDKLKTELGLVDISTCSVIHCPWAYGLSLTHSSGWKLVYSGDTRPCANLITLGRAGDKAPTILLHEATLPDELVQDAIAKRHSTVSEAVAMAVGMGAENLLLTHFSQRCLSLPRWKSNVVRSVKLNRYGYIAGGGASGNTTPVSGSNSASISAATTATPEPDAQAGGGPLDGLVSTDDTRAAKEALMRELGEPLSDESDTEDGALKGRPYENLNIASAFDMTVYAPSDIRQYRANVSGLRRALYKELALFIAEDKQASEADANEDASRRADAAPSPKAKGPSTSKSKSKSKK
ncbi:hypothetical protein LPJ61_001861 [Coemansia biformis]|uniref:ribonuclease Z n=1 Tax=Coemansia biformis TaxID=1286918 RepID=A0A9W8CWX9_9FUNG|nr:hypothetical protein LPJ61_001861 [Coemansia biformis]